MADDSSVAVIAVAALLSSIFIVDEREKALVLQFGRVVAVKEEPGLAFKIPFIQEVVRYDDRILSLDTPAIEVTPSDDRRLVVDAPPLARVDLVTRRASTAVLAAGFHIVESRVVEGARTLVPPDTTVCARARRSIPSVIPARRRAPKRRARIGAPSKSLARTRLSRTLRCGKTE